MNYNFEPSEIQKNIFIFGLTTTVFSAMFGRRIFAYKLIKRRNEVAQNILANYTDYKF
ncbi:MAG: hypothetical protein ABIF40_05480 [archaeon]